MKGGFLNFNTPDEFLASTPFLQLGRKKCVGLTIVAYHATGRPSPLATHQAYPEPVRTTRTSPNFVENKSRNGTNLILYLREWCPIHYYPPLTTE